MVNLLAAELLKLKRSKMVLLSVIGAAFAPLMVVLAFYISKNTRPAEEVAGFDVLFYNTSMYTILLIGVPLYSVVTAYLFNREYVEDTLKNLLTIPVSRTQLLLSKMLLLLLWILLLTGVAWVLTIVFGWIGQFEGLSGALLGKTLVQYFIAGLFMFILSTPIILITLVMKNYVPTIIAALIINLVNVLAFNSEHRGLVPWAAAFDISNGTLMSTYPAWVSYLIIGSTALICFITALIYFRKVDIH
ncbi:ABC transporter permease [Paenibacillus albidus]|uniref:ABC transporter permease n=1 Tax=Paenibacillus albidus TaxID=2041023 RepID=UPI001BE509DE|nr:ABC transporter permease [Paenibacillus albidus]MBT2289403.1 ABC transporter permease [Paenibacillus albidus]